MMKKRILYIICIILLGVGVVWMARDNPDWTLPVSIRAQEIGYLAVDVAAQSIPELNIRITSQASPIQVDLITPQLDVNVTNSVLNVKVQDTAKPIQVDLITPQLDVNVTNSVLNVRITSQASPIQVDLITPQLDVNVTNSVLDVKVQGTANVNVENAQLNVRNLREQVVDLTQIEGFSSSIYVGPRSGETATVFTNNENITVYLEYFSVAVIVGGAYLPADTLSPMSVNVELYLKDPNGRTVLMLASNGGMFLNLDPAIPIPPGYSLKVSVGNASSKGLFVDIAGIIRKIPGV